MPRKRRKDLSNFQNGNVLFIILIAVALFASLSYAVTKSGRSGAGDVSKEQAKLIAGQVANYGVALRGAITRLIVNCDPSQISFHSELISTGANNPNAPVNKECHVFDPAGGGMFPLTDIPVGLEKITFQNRGEYQYQSIMIPDLGTNKNEVVVALAFYGPKEVCQQFNALMGHDEYVETLPEISARYWMSHRAYGGTIYANGGNGTGRLLDFAGKDAGCVYNINDYNNLHPRYVIFMALMEL